MKKKNKWNFQCIFLIKNTELTFFFTQTYYSSDLRCIRPFMQSVIIYLHGA